MKTQIYLDVAGLCHVLPQVLQGHNTSNTANMPVVPKNYFWGFSNSSSSFYSRQKVRNAHHKQQIKKELIWK